MVAFRRSFHNGFYRRIFIVHDHGVGFFFQGLPDGTNAEHQKRKEADLFHNAIALKVFLSRTGPPIVNSRSIARMDSSRIPRSTYPFLPVGECSRRTLLLPSR